MWLRVSLNSKIVSDHAHDEVCAVSICKRLPKKNFRFLSPYLTVSATLEVFNGDYMGEIPPNRLLAITFDWSVLGTSG